MRIFVGFCLVIMLLAALAFMLLSIGVWHEEEQEKNRRRKAVQCKENIKSGICPKNCAECKWGGYEN